MIKIAPSLLSADFSCLADEIKKVKAAGADMLHLDVMDGHFVPNLTIGPAVVASIRKVTRLPLDTHLMIERPWDFVDAFIDAGSDMITVHIEAVTKLKVRSLKLKVKAKGVKLGVSLNPGTPLKEILPVLEMVDFVLVMSVKPGFGGQKFIPAAVNKVKQLRKVFPGDISVDGGVNDLVAPELIRAGANILAVGSYIFRAADIRGAMERIRHG